MRVQAEFLNTMPPREFVDCITDDLFRQGVFVFTPGGQAMRLPKVLGCPRHPPPAPPPLRPGCISQGWLHLCSLHQRTRLGL